MTRKFCVKGSKLVRTILRDMGVPEGETMENEALCKHLCGKFVVDEAVWMRIMNALSVTCTKEKIQELLGESEEYSDSEVHRILREPFKANTE